MTLRDRLIKNSLYTVEHDDEVYELAKLSGSDFAAIQAEIARLGEDESLEDGVRDMRVAALMVIYSLVEDGQRAFTVDDLDFVVDQVPLALVRKIGEAVNVQNGLTVSEEDAAKNS